MSKSTSKEDYAAGFVPELWRERFEWMTRSWVSEVVF